jgi:hypothetical protein
MDLLPKCKCGNGNEHNAVEFVTKKEGPTKGKAFFTCAKKSDKCGFWIWSEQWHKKIAEPPKRFVMAKPNSSRNNDSDDDTDMLYERSTDVSSSSKVSAPKRTTVSEPSTSSDPKPIANDGYFTNMAKRIDESFLKPVEQHTVTYNAIMNDTYSLEKYSHVQRFVKQLNLLKFENEQCSIYEMIHHNKHLLINAKDYSKAEWSVWIQPSMLASFQPQSGISNNKAHPTLRIQLHGQQKTNEGWLNGKATKIAFEFGELFVVIDRKMLKKFIDTFVVDEKTIMDGNQKVTLSSGCGMTAQDIEQKLSSDVVWNNVRYKTQLNSSSMFESFAIVYLKHVFHYITQQQKEDKKLASKTVASLVSVITKQKQ